MDGADDAMRSETRLSRGYQRLGGSFVCLLGTTKDDPKDTTLPSFHATFATAFAKRIPFCTAHRRKYP